jgi:hypothetical protein
LFGKTGLPDEPESASEPRSDASPTDAENGPMGFAKTSLDDVDSTPLDAVCEFVDRSSPRMKISARMINATKETTEARRIFKFMRLEQC